MSDPLRVVIVDDEPLARAVVREYLGAHPGVEVVAECGNGFEAVKAVAELSPDLVFLDVQMPKLSGFEVLELLGRDVPVIFTTAYDQYALRAFEVHAVDYLLKPFSEERFAEALSRARERLRAKAQGGPDVDDGGADATPCDQGAARARADPRRRAGPRAAGRPDRLRRSAGRLRVLRRGRQAVSEGPDAGGGRGPLDPARFVRIHRSYLLNIERIAPVELYAKDSRVAILRDGRRLPVSRAGYARLAKLL